MKNNTSSLDSNRVKFNWGFWDGRNDAKNERNPIWTSPHQWPAYEAGYNAGRASDLNANVQDSTNAWIVSGLEN